MKPFIGPAAAVALGVLTSVGVSGAGAADKPYEGDDAQPRVAE